MKPQYLISNLSAILFFIILTETISFAQKKEKDTVLANKIYTVEFTEHGGKNEAKPVSWDISFKSGRMNSTFMREIGGVPTFLPAPYIVTVDSSSDIKMISFTAESSNSDKDILKWKGIISGIAIEGTALLGHEGKTKREYSFTGSLKDQKKK